jgi:ligand-binding SRPBCC domain-containing protein
MTTIRVSTMIRAPREICFDLARDVDVHVRTTADTHEQAVAGRTTGLLELGDTVTWEATHLGVRQRLTARIDQLDRPNVFVDEMLSGAFHSQRHVHEFVSSPEGTVMIDRLTYEPPLWLLGRLADLMAVRQHMRHFLERRARRLKSLAEQAVDL